MRTFSHFLDRTEVDQTIQDLRVRMSHIIPPAIVNRKPKFIDVTVLSLSNAVSESRTLMISTDDQGRGMRLTGLECSSTHVQAAIGRVIDEAVAAGINIFPLPSGQNELMATLNRLSLLIPREHDKPECWIMWKYRIIVEPWHHHPWWYSLTLSWWDNDPTCPWWHNLGDQFESGASFAGNRSTQIG